MPYKDRRDWTQVILGVVLAVAAVCLFVTLSSLFEKPQQHWSGGGPYLASQDHRPGVAFSSSGAMVAG